MRTVDETVVAASLERTFAVAADVERWPAFLSHYRWVTMLERRPPGRGGIVEMAAWRPFGPVRYPTWWVSEMEVNAAARIIRYRHIRGITKEMDVEWRVAGRDGRVHVSIVHEWDGPRWPVIGRVAADWIIGPIFIHAIASRTLAGVKHQAEQS